MLDRTPCRSPHSLLPPIGSYGNLLRSPHSYRLTPLALKPEALPNSHCSKVFSLYRSASLLSGSCSRRWHHPQRALVDHLKLAAVYTAILARSSLRLSEHPRRPHALCEYFNPCACIIWYCFQCNVKKKRINYLTLPLVVTMSYAC